MDGQEDNRGTMQRSARTLASDHGRIVPLPQEVASQIKSSIVITSLVDAILGLMKNSLDAGATKIEISVNHTRGGCTVEDDGIGIYPADLAESGGLGKMHQTSKAESDDVHGKTGTFLASLAAMSLLTVISRHQNYRQCNSVTFHQSRVVSRLIPCPEHQEIQSSRHGTRVLVRDLFGNFPVRVKQRASLPDSEMDRTWNELKLALIALLLTWESDVSLKLLNEENGQTMLNLRPKSSYQSTKGAMKTPSKLPWLLTHGGFLTPGSKYNWVPASASSTNVKIKGVIALEPTPTRNLQFLSIGLYPVDKSAGADIYDFINQRFKNSHFGVIDEDNGIGREIMSNRYEIRPRDLKPVKRGVERWPMYDLRISFPNNAAMTGKAVMGEQRVLEKVMNMLDALVTNWLATHYFTTNLKSTLDESKRNSPVQAAPNITTSATASPSPFSKQTRARLVSTTPRKFSNSAQSRMSPLFRSKIQEKDIIEPTIENSGINSTTEMSDSDASVHTNSPTTGQKHEMTEQIESQTYKRVRKGSRRLTLRPDIKPNPEKPIAWLDSLLEKWENPVFQITEQGIRKSYEDFEKASGQHGCCGESKSLMPNTANDFAFASGSKLTKTSLEKARFIGHVGNQFILIQVADDKEQDMLVAVDQHAADERCKVEQLFAEFCTPLKKSETQIRSNLGLKSSLDCRLLEKSLTFELAEQELDHFRSRARAFANWGVLFDIEMANESLGEEKGKLIVRGLSPTIAARASSDPQLLITLLRTEMWKMVEQGRPSVDHPDETNKDLGHSWLRKIGRCPKGIVELINSRACRSAIMFNDPLTENECKGLIQALAKCAFPFQCAHGRPSMVPLIHFRKTGLGLEENVGKIPFVEAFDAWKKRSQDDV